MLVMTAGSPHPMEKVSGCTSDTAIEDLSCVLRKPVSAKTKAQISSRSRSEADQKQIRAFLFLYIDGTKALHDFRPLAIFWGCTARFVSDLFRNSKDRFSSEEAYLLAHLSRRLIGELIVYPWSGVRRPSVDHKAQTSSSQKLLGRSKPNFMWSLLG